MTEIKIRELEWYRRIKAAETFFKKQSVLDEIKACSSVSVEFLRKNKSSYTAAALEQPNKPWWPDLKHTSDERILETRGMNLRGRLWEHGNYDLLRNFEKKHDFQIDPLVSLIGDGSTFAIALNLIARKYADGPTMALAEFSALYGYSDSSGDDKARDAKLVPLVEIGLFSARFKSQWAISIGPVSEAFFDNIYFPMIKDFNINPPKQEG